MENKDVFISYRAKETAHASWVKSVLETNGISCWMAPDSIPGGSDYAREIPAAISSCKIVVLILSKKAQQSKWIRKEIALAINSEKIIMPFMIENCNLTDDFNLFLSNVQRYAAYENKLNVMRKMLGEIYRILGKEPADNSDYSDNDEVVATVQKPAAEPSPIIKFIKALTPYGRKGAKDDKIKYPLNVITALMAITYFPLITGFIDKPGMFFVFLAVIFAHWYLLYGACIRIGTFKYYNKFLACISAFAVFVLTIVLTFCAFAFILSRILY